MSDHFSLWVLYPVTFTFFFTFFLLWFVLFVSFFWRWAVVFMCVVRVLFLFVCVELLDTQINISFHCCCYYYYYYYYCYCRLHLPSHLNVWCVCLYCAIYFPWLMHSFIHSFHKLYVCLFVFFFVRFLFLCVLSSERIFLMFCSNNFVFFCCRQIYKKKKKTKTKKATNMNTFASYICMLEWLDPSRFYCFPDNDRKW